VVGAITKFHFHVRLPTVAPRSPTFGPAPTPSRAPEADGLATSIPVWVARRNAKASRTPPPPPPPPPPPRSSPAQRRLTPWRRGPFPTGVPANLLRLSGPSISFAGVRAIPVR